MVLRHVLFIALALLPLLQAPQPPRNLRLAQTKPVTTYYVSPLGNDGNSSAQAQTGVQTDAKFSIVAGLGLLSGGDTLIIYGGTYFEVLHYSIIGIPSGSAGIPTIIRANPGDTVTVKPPGGTDDALALVGIFGPSYISFIGINFDANNDVNGTVTVEYPSEHIRFEDCEIKNAIFNGVGFFASYNELINCDVHTNGFSATFGAGGSWGYGVYITGGNNLIEGNDIHFNSRYGLHLYSQVGSVNDNMTRKNRIYQNGQEASGAEILVGGARNKFHNNLIYAGNRVGIGGSVGVPITQHCFQVEYSGPEDIEIYHNSCFNMSGYAVSIGNDSSVTGTLIKDNIFRTMDLGTIDNGAGASGTVDSNNLTTDPDWVDAAGGDFRLLSTSDAIDAGVDVGVTTDFAGATRDASPDIGAYEFDGDDPDPPDPDLSSPAKRKSAIGIPLHWLRPGIIPTGSNLDTVGERMHAQAMYAASSESASSLVKSIRERVGLSDRLRGQLVDAELRAIRERVGLSDRLTFLLLDSISVTMRERLGVSDRLSGISADAVAKTMRERLGLRDRASAEQQQPYGPAMVALTHFFLKTGRENYSGHRVIAPDHTHEPRVISFGSYEKEVEVPSGPPRLADWSITLDDSPDPVTKIQHFRSTFGAITPRMSEADVKIGPVGGKEHLFIQPAKGSIRRVTFPPLQAIVDGSDLRAKWLDKPLPMVINPANFPNLPPGVTEAFFPFVLGIIESELGALKAVHVDTVNHRYTAAYHPIESVEVFTKTPAETEFQLTPYSYTLVQVELVLDGRANHPNYIQFASALPEGTEVQYNCHGVNFRGEWGTLPQINEVNRNVVDHTINMAYYMKRLDEPVPDFSDYDVHSFAEVREKIEALGILSDLAITEPLTGQEIITQLHAPPVVFMVPDNHNRIKLVKITDEDLANAITIDDRTGTLLRSEVISLAGPTYNQYRYRRALNHTNGQWGAEEVYDNAPDQEVLGEIEALQVDFYSIRDQQVSAELIAERSLWEDQEAHRIRLRLEAKHFLDTIDLLRVIKLRHYGGLAEGGWVDEFFVIYRYMLVIDNPMIIEIDAIRRTVIAVPEPQVGLIGEWSWNSRVGPEYLTVVRRMYLWFVDTRASKRKLVVLETNADGVLIPVDDGIYPTTANEIGSHDGIVVGVMLHLGTQEKSTGRAAYSRFNCSTRQYEILNATILASNSDGDYGITLDVQDPSGKVTVMLQGDREFSSGFAAFPAAGPEGDYQRAYVTVRNTNGTWTTPAMMGGPADAFASNPWFNIWGDPNYNGAVHIQTGRAKAGYSNRVHFAFSRLEPGDVALTPDFMVQTLRADGTLSTAHEFETTGGGGGGANSSPFLGGDPARFEDEDGQVWIAFPIGKLSEPKIVLFRDIDNPTAPTRQVILSTAAVQPDTFGARWAPIGVRELNGTLHAIHGTRAPSSTEWAAHKTISEPFASATAAPSYTANARDVRVGAIFGVNDYARSGFDIKTLRDGRTYIFKVTSGNFGISGVNDGKWIFEKIDIEDLPTSYTLAEFIADPSNP